MKKANFIRKTLPSFKESRKEIFVEHAKKKKTNLHSRVHLKIYTIKFRTIFTKK